MGRLKGARRLALILACVGLFAGSYVGPNAIDAAQGARFGRIAYSVSMPQPTAHLFSVRVELETPPGAALPHVDLQMPAWQPGRYAVADFAKNVQEFAASASGEALRFEKIDAQTWRIQTSGNRKISASYKVFGDDLSGTYAQLDGTHGNFTGDRKSTRLNSSHVSESRMPSSA